MSTAKYDPSVDFSDENLSQTLLARLVGEGRTVLDVGCATGYLASMLRSQGCRVDGIEYDPVMAERAAAHVDRLEVGDVQEMDLLALFGPASYDVVVFGDVLEHLTRPAAVLRASLALLKPGGAVVASIPNVAHGAVRLALLSGRFAYTSTGLLDDTHVRFFTRDSVLALFEEAGLAVVALRRTQADLFDTEVEVVEGDVDPAVVELVRADPEATTYQFVLRAVPVAEADPRAVEAVRVAEAARVKSTSLSPIGAQAVHVPLPSVPPARVGLWGGWDLDDLTQALVGRVVSAELARRLPGVLLRFAAPHGSEGGLRTGLGEPVEELGAAGDLRRRLLADGLDAVLVTGALVTDAVEAAGRYARPPREDEPALHLLQGPEGIPVLWGPVRVDGGESSCVPAGRQLAAGALTPLPDPGLLAPRVLSVAEARRRQRYLHAAGWLALSERVVAVHLAGGTATGPVLQLLQRLVDADPCLSVVALELDTSTADGAPANEITTAMQDRALLCPVDAGVDSAMAALACADLVLSTSPTARAVASAYGVPALGLDELSSAEDRYEEARTGRREVSEEVRAGQAALDRWFDEVAETVRATVAPEAERGVLAATERYAAMERAHAVMRARTSSEVLRASEAVPHLVVTDHGELEAVRRELAALRSTRSFRALQRPRSAYARLRKLVR